MSEMSYEFQSETKVWIDLGNAGDDRSGVPLKLTISEVARLYRVLGATLRAYSEMSTEVLTALGEESDLS